MFAPKTHTHVYGVVVACRLLLNFEYHTLLRCRNFIIHFNAFLMRLNGRFP